MKKRTGMNKIKEKTKWFSTKSLSQEEDERIRSLLHSNNEDIKIGHNKEGNIKEESILQKNIEAALQENSNSEENSIKTINREDSINENKKDTFYL
ncbi:uncharacterized protein VNE69_03144 [Vairimorpha necatrix]|uniref:Uncharacterized protein n=1 Tax=Vairimorpha necatrix TaxID=6039 RepID=A0AAX4JAD6_9MICR